MKDKSLIITLIGLAIICLISIVLALTLDCAKWGKVIALSDATVSILWAFGNIFFDSFKEHDNF